jgi:hypothetical protein
MAINGINKSATPIVTNTVGHDPALPAIPVHFLFKSETKHSVLRRCFETLPGEVGL